MDQTRLTKEGVAQELYGNPYSSLSAWAKAHVDQFVNESQLGASNIDDLKLKRQIALEEVNQDLESENEQLKLENADLWNENEELKIRLAQLGEEE